jgi:hypothetical protein
MWHITAGRAKGLAHATGTIVVFVALLEHISIGRDRGWPFRDIAACMLLFANMVFAVIGAWRSAFCISGALGLTCVIAHA